jgi:hypothetical protein
MTNIQSWMKSSKFAKFNVNFLLVYTPSRHANHRCHSGTLIRCSSFTTANIDTMLEIGLSEVDVVLRLQNVLLWLLIADC